jgi:hypothetical protein
MPERRRTEDMRQTVDDRRQQWAEETAEKRTGVAAGRLSGVHSRHHHLGAGCEIRALPATLP